MKRKLALLLALSLVLSLLPAGVVFAEENGDDYDNGEYVEADYDNDEDAENGDEDYDEDEDDDADDEDYNDDEVAEEDEEEYVGFTPISTELDATVIRFVIGEVAFTINDVAQAPLDAAPFIDATVGRTMVPLRAAGESLGAEVDWDVDTREVIVIADGVYERISADEDLPGGMGRPAIVADRVFVPIAYLSELLGATRDWNPDTQAVYIFN